MIKKGGMESDEGRRAATELDACFIKQNISPGGCADLLAVTAAIYLMEGPFFLSSKASLANIHQHKQEF